MYKTDRCSFCGVVHSVLAQKIVERYRAGQPLEWLIQEHELTDLEINQIIHEIEDRNQRQK